MAHHTSSFMKSNITALPDDEQNTADARLQGALAIIGCVCHELNQPLQIALGSSELLLMKVEENTPLYESITKIKRQLDHMGRITRKLAMISSLHYRALRPKEIFDIENISY